jgi:CelD/BcsL family acetyltransferase involved in cellulose biosynthesis
MYELDPVADRRWQRFLQAHPRASVFHSPEWLQALNKTYGYEPVAFVDAPPGQEISCGQVFCVVRSWLTGTRLVSVPFSDHSALLLERPDELHRIMEALKQTERLKRYGYVELRPTQDLLFENTGFRNVVQFYLQTIDLDRDSAAIYRSFHKDCVQRKIKRSEREKLSYSGGRGEGILNQFYELLLLTHKRHHTPPQPRVWFRNLAQCLGEMMTIRIASRDGKPIAGIVTVTYKDVMMYKYGCSDARCHDLGGMAFLLWRSIQEAKELGMRVFDLGRSDVAHAGLIAFKEHWGSERHPLRYWRHPGQAFRGRHGSDFKALKTLLPLAPSAVLRLGGPILYRHMA